MGARKVVVVLGLLGQFPLAGIAWQLIPHLAGLQGLGFEVYYIEDTGTAPYDPRVKSLIYDCTIVLIVCISLPMLSSGWEWRMPGRIATAS